MVDTRSGDITITSVDLIRAFDVVTGMGRWTMDQLQNATFRQGEESTPITGRSGITLNTLKRNKTIGLSGTNALLSAGLLETQTGSPFKHEEKALMLAWENLAIVNGTAETTWVGVAPAGVAGTEIKAVRVLDANNVAIVELTQASTVTPQTFTYDPATKELVVDTGTFDDGTRISVDYYRHVAGDVLRGLSSNYSSKEQIYLDCTGEDVCARQFHVQIYIPRADFVGNFEIAMGGTDQAVHAFEITALGGACGTAGELFVYTIVGGAAPDAT
jgi:hypothetical protein